MRFARASSTPFRLAPTGLLILGIVALSACGRDPVAEIAGFAHHQRDQVTTRLVPAHSDLAGRLATDGWRRGDEEESEPRLRMTRDRARLWFFSTDGATTRAVLHGSVTGDGDAARAISYRVNGQHQGIKRWRPGDESLALPFKAKAARAGWNALDLYVKRGQSEGLLELEGLRFLDGRQVASETPRTLSVEEGVLLMPAESFLDAALELPGAARLDLAAENEAGPRDDEPLVARVRLLDDAGAWHELADFRLDPGESESVRVDLDSWSGQPVSLRFTVDGPRSSTLRWTEAAIHGRGERFTAAAPIRPAPVEASGRLERPDVFVVVLDAARADAFGTYGAEHPTPAVDALAAAGTRFERALAPSSWTGQSIPALLAGFHPDTLGIERWGDPLPDKVPNVAELMAAAGYRTVLWSQHPIYNRAESLVRGFEHVRYSGRRKRDRLPSRKLLFAPGRPTFAMIHLLPPHSPYAPPAPFRGSYSADYKGDLPPKLGALGRIGKKRAVRLTQEDHAYIRSRYLENVAYADWLVGQVVATLEASERFDDALVIVTSDHGEAFFEHGQFMHSRELYREFIHIPMVVKWPASAPRAASAIAEPVSLTDVLPTLADGLGLGGAEGGFQGRSLLPAAFDGAALDRAIYATTRGLGDITKTAKPRWMLELGDWRVIHDPIAASTELYAVEADPNDLEDLADRHPALTRLLLQDLLMQRRFNLGLLQLGPRDEVELDPELIEELKALGYL